MMDSVGLIYEKFCARVLVQVQALGALAHLNFAVGLIMDTEWRRGSQS